MVYKHYSVLHTTVKEPTCDGDLVYSTCHSACPLVCNEPDPFICPMSCNIGCACPSDLYRGSEDDIHCYKKEDCPVADTGNIKPHIFILTGQCCANYLTPFETVWHIFWS